MNKYKQLSRTILKLALVRVAIIALFVGLYFFTDSLVSDSADQKTAAETAFNADQGQIGNLTTQLEKSSIAEKRFITTQKDRINLDFLSNTESLKAWLRNAKAQYRLSNSFKLSLTNEKPGISDDSSGTNYDVLEHPSMKLEFGAMTDTHVFSFIDDFLRNATGFMQIDTLTMKRNGDIDSNIVSQMRSGSAPYLMDTKVEFNWIGLREKLPKDGTTPAPEGAK